MLDDEVPLIGFAGSPWTIMCYAVKDKDLKALISKKDFSHQKRTAHVLCKKLPIRLFYIYKKRKQRGVDSGF
jgi:uroporphyrinogen decarboxylase